MLRAAPDPILNAGIIDVTTNASALHNHNARMAAPVRIAINAKNRAGAEATVTSSANNVISAAKHHTNSARHDWNAQSARISSGQKPPAQIKRNKRRAWMARDAKVAGVAAGAAAVNAPRLVNAWRWQRQRNNPANRPKHRAWRPLLSFRCRPYLL